MEATQCPVCALPTDTGDRFCTACGEALAVPAAAPASSLSVDDPLDEPELLHLAPASGRQGPERGARRGPGARMWGAIGAGVLAVAIAAWAIGRAGGERADGVGLDEPAPTSSTPTSSTPATSVSVTDVAATDAPDPSSAANAPTYDADAGGPVLGRPVGWSLFIGDPYQTRLERLDLDTGERLDYEGVTSAPVAALDGRLMLLDQQEAEATLRIVPVDDPAAEGIEIMTSGSSFGSQWPLAPGGDGALWLYGESAGATTWRLVRIRDGKLLDEVAAPPSFQVYPVAGGGPDVATSTSGGVYRRDGTGYRLISPGRPVAVNQGVVLVTTCSTPIDCRLQWLDAETGEPADRPLPPAGGVPGVEWSAVVDPAGRFLVGYLRISPTGAYRLVLFDRDRDRVIEVDLDAFYGGLAASPDGRFLAATSNRGLVLYDADQERWTTVRRASYEGASVVFVANGEAR